jgi:hypothetical protein
MGTYFYSIKEHYDELPNKIFFLPGVLLPSCLSEHSMLPIGRLICIYLYVCMYVCQYEYLHIWLYIIWVYVHEYTEIV